MAWKDKLQPASFRGVPFHVEDDDLTAGRRVQVNEYPQRDKPYAEDLGRATREIRITGFVIGADYLDARDRLLGAVEEPGPGTLVHPWFGSLQVVVTECSVRQSAREGGMARFALAFVEAGELTFPQAATATGAKVRMAADTLAAAATDDFADQFSLKGAPDFVVESALQRLGDALGAVRSGLAGVSSGIGGAVDALVGGLDGLVATPRSLAGEVFGVFSDLASLAGVPSRALGAVRALLAVFDSPALRAPSSTAGRTPARTRELRTSAAIAALVRRAAVIEAAKASALAPMPVFDDAVAVRGQLTTALDHEGFTAPDPVFTALTDLRVSVHQDITARTRDSARLSAVTPREVLPAVVLAYDLYEDAARGDEIVARNRVIHPGFLPAEPLLVLSR